jgi:hypothetical protein
MAYAICSIFFFYLAFNSVSHIKFATFVFFGLLFGWWATMDFLTFTEEISYEMY